MGWYVSRRGETIGPVEDAQVAQWVRGGMTDAMLRAENSAEWITVGRSPFAKFAPSRRAWIVAGSILAVLTPLMLLGLCVELADPEARKRFEAQAAAQAGPAARPEPEPSAEPESNELVCKIQIPGSSGRVPGFPTEAGMDEYSKAAAEGLSDEDITVIALSNGGKLIESGTKCFWVDAGFLRTRARMLEGPLTGQCSGSHPSGHVSE